jgi:hypothetical protein
VSNRRESADLWNRDLAGAQDQTGQFLVRFVERGKAKSRHNKHKKEKKEGNAANQAIITIALAITVEDPLSVAIEICEFSMRCDRGSTILIVRTINGN